MRDIGKNIKNIRQTKGMTQDTMAEALFVTRQTVSNYENGRSRPDLDMLLRIAEVLETDVNTIIYGPPIPQSKKDSYKWLTISAGVLFAVSILHFTLTCLFPKETSYGLDLSVRVINKLTLLPALMFVLGWFLMQCLSAFSNLKQIRPEKSKVLRIVALTVLVLVVVIPIPYIIFYAVAGYRSYVYHSVSMHFPYIPVYQEAYRALELAIYKSPFVYTILGGIAWLLGLPSIKGKTAAVPDRENG